MLLIFRYEANTPQHGVRVTNSVCTSAHTIKYLETGALPPLDSVCEPSGKVFDTPLEQKRRKRALDGLRGRDWVVES